MSRIHGKPLLVGWFFALIAQAALAQPLTVPAAPDASARGPAQEAATQDAAIASAAPLTLARALALAEQGNPDLAVARREIEALQGPVLQSRALPNPELSYTEENVTSRARARSRSAQLNLPIELGGKRAARMSVAQRDVELATENLQARRIEIHAAVVAAFFETLTAQEHAALAQDSIDLAKRAAEAAGKRVTAGKISPVEQTKAKVAEAQANIDLLQAQNDQRAARRRLVALLGVNAPGFAAVVGSAADVPVAPSAQALRQRLLDSPVLREARLQVQRRQAMLDVERSKRVPNLTVGVGVQRGPDDRRNQFTLGVSLPLPLFDRNQGNILEAAKRKDQASDALEATQVRLDSELMQAQERLQSISQQVMVLQHAVVPGARSAYEAASIGFENGKFSFLEVLDAQRTYFAAKSQYVAALAQAHRTVGDIDKVLGDADASAHFAPSVTPAASQD